ncbi:acyl carrier protein [Paractinoplanes ferrugineus]|uniref:Acyl carrier protein n=1 Tax=Paractinoplanes ferrugineus TaxID=113564 RepID=A0A919MB41_9ACTN|nr:acyl carrier protein [Actinoplanes ferrugineus]GIE13261.1 acyl carrier protein [Actinoplanes ferrugineus]
MPVADRLHSVFVTALELVPDDDVEHLQHRDHPRWDSLGHLALVVAIEDEFEVELTSDQLIGISSFAAALSTLRELGVRD